MCLKAILAFASYILHKKDTTKYQLSLTINVSKSIIYHILKFSILHLLFNVKTI